jgi:hypothetical protein
MMSNKIIPALLTVLLGIAVSADFSETPDVGGANVVLFQGFKSMGNRSFRPMDKNTPLKLGISTNLEFRGNLKFEIPAQDTEGSPHWIGCEIFPVSGTNGFDLNPDNQNTEFFLWMYALPFNQKDNHINVRIFDTDSHSLMYNKVEQWFKQKARFKDWTRLSIGFDKLPETLNLHSIKKIQIVVYWPGTYYFSTMGSSSGK